MKINDNYYPQALFTYTMAGDTQLKRFIDAQERDYEIALAEIRNGRKRGHWMWYVFPQVKGLGFSSTSQLYGIANLKEAEAYLRHPVLGQRLITISNELLNLENANAADIFGNPDNMKLRSAMTLFAAVKDSDPVFQQVLDKYFLGKADLQTLTILNRGHS
ncbi:MAG: DUF1810 domain-containing protein [Mucilaginibacter sp.]